MREIVFNHDNPRRTLAGISNGWLYKEQIAEARRLAEEGTDEECASYLTFLEDECNSALAGWRAYQ